jgi:hypothetical protein
MKVEVGRVAAGQHALWRSIRPGLWSGEVPFDEGQGPTLPPTGAASPPASMDSLPYETPGGRWGCRRHQPTLRRNDN